MEGKGRALDNVFIERFWRTIKYQHIYLNPADDGITLYQESAAGWTSTTINPIRESAEKSQLSCSKWLPDSIKNTSKVV
jgi:hypothetical protein